ncbi:hypothetical protein [Pseudomonas sp. DY-1]|uniref:hypothetical protein n=1 Tax=Pseudomonas sp. DY-1 TaxID=1755504 RepID=UPI001575276B|nr:hypothetical protein [Pseudomonas sp. DY-1]
MPEFPEFPQFHPAPPPDAEVLLPATFIRHKRQLRAVLLDEEPWFSASDLARLINHAPLPERVSRNLDEDQLQRVWMRNSHGDFEQELLVSESGVYTVLILYYHREESLHPPMAHPRGDSSPAGRGTLPRPATLSRSDPGAGADCSQRPEMPAGTTALHHSLTTCPPVPKQTTLSANRSDWRGIQSASPP